MQARVETIEWISEAAQEAEVAIATSDVSLLAFCHPCELEIGSMVTSPIHALGARGIELDPGASHSVRSTGGFGHMVTGVLIDWDRQIVSSCGFLIALDDYLPGGLSVGDTISFHCGRLDIW